MRIGCNALCAENRSGTGRYTAQLLCALAEIDTENTYVVCVREGTELEERLRQFAQFEVTPVRAAGPLSRLFFERFTLPAWIDRNGLDLFHGPAFVLPARCSVPMVVTVHDLVFHLFPEMMPLSRRAYYRRAIPRSIAQAAMVLCDSTNTQRDVIKHFGVPESKAAAVHLGVEERFLAKPTESDLQRVRQTYSLPERFILSVGTLEPRKNIPRLIDAYTRLAASVGESVPHLVIAGRKGWGLRGLKRPVAARGLVDRVHFCGFVEDQDIPVLYRLADVFAYVSLYEGFGLPVLEAMAAGTPVVAGNNSSIPEITGDLACLVDVESVERIAEGLGESLQKNGPSPRVHEALQARARSFSWRATAEKTLEAYELTVW